MSSPNTTSPTISPREEKKVTTNETETEDDNKQPKNQGLLNFEKCLAKIEVNLRQAITQRRELNSRKKIENWKRSVENNNNNHASSNNSSRSNSGRSTPRTQNNNNTYDDLDTSAIALVEAIIQLIETNYVDGLDCNVPPSNFGKTPGLTTVEALSLSYGDLVEDFKRLRGKWNKSQYETNSNATRRSRASSISSTSSSVAKSKFGVSKQQQQQQVQNDDDGDNNDDQQQQLLQEQQDKSPEILEFERKQREERLRNYEEIGHQVRSVRDLQSEINTLVDSHQPALDTTEKNVEAAADKVQKGREELFKAVKYSSFGAGIAGGLVGALLGGPAGFVLGAQSGIALAASAGTGALVGGVGAHKFSNKAVEGSKDAETDRKFDELKKNVEGAKKDGNTADSKDK